MIRRLLRLLGLLDRPDVTEAMRAHPAGHARPLEMIPADGMCCCEGCYDYWDLIYRNHDLHDLAVMARVLDWPQ